MDQPNAIETFNEFGVGAIGGDVAIIVWQRRLSKPQALRLAAWLVAMADDDDQFPKVLEAVVNT